MAVKSVNTASEVTRPWALRWSRCCGTTDRSHCLLHDKPPSTTSGTVQPHIPANLKFVHSWKGFFETFLDDHTTYRMTAVRRSGVLLRKGCYFKNVSTYARTRININFAVSSTAQESCPSVHMPSEPIVLHFTASSAQVHANTCRSVARSSHCLSR